MTYRKEKKRGKKEGKNRGQKQKKKKKKPDVSLHRHLLKFLHM